MVPLVPEEACPLPQFLQSGHESRIDILVGRFAVGGKVEASPSDSYLHNVNRTAPRNPVTQLARTDGWCRIVTHADRRQRPSTARWLVSFPDRLDAVGANGRALFSARRTAWCV